MADFRSGGTVAVPAWQALDVVRRSFVSVQRGQFPAALKQMRPDMTFDSRTTWAGSQVLVGHAGFLAAMTAWYEPWKDIASDLIEITARDGCALLLFSERMTADGGAHQDWIHVWRCEVAEEGVSAVVTFPSRDAGLAAARLDGAPGAVVQAAWNALARRDEAAWRDLHAPGYPLGDWFHRPAGCVEPTALEHLETVGNTVIGVLDESTAPAPGRRARSARRSCTRSTDNRISQLQVFPTPAEARAAVAAAPAAVRV